MRKDNGAKKTKKRMSRKLKYSLCSVVIIIVLMSGYVIHRKQQGNFHCVTESKAYRSGQLDTDKLEHYISKYNIKSVLNLRGENSDKQWYLDETDVCKRNNVAHYDLSLSARREPSDKDIKQMIEIFETAPHPILIHCRGGSDRSSLASAIWKVVVEGKTKEQAKDQLSVYYGHLPFGETAAMDIYFDKWDPQQPEQPEQPEPAN